MSADMKSFVQHLPPEPEPDAEMHKLVRQLSTDMKGFLEAIATPKAKEFKTPKSVGVGMRLHRREPKATPSALRCFAKNDGPAFEVTGLLPGGPADRSNMIEIGDILVGAEHSSVKDLTIDDACACLLGPEGSTLLLEFEKKGTSMVYEVPLQRERANPR